jgi:hypothetical protein
MILGSEGGSCVLDCGKGGAMKRVMMLAVVLVLGMAHADAHGRGSVGFSFGVFYSSLDPYGEWITIGHGVYGWRPVHAAPAWRPYSHGRWIWTDDGWYWASDEPWAWAVYHYGRWHYDDYYGWVWIPGSEWAPAWVEWRYGPSCVGWAPLGPYAIFDGFYGIRYATTWVVPVHHWTFVNVHYMGMHDMTRHIYPASRNREFVRRTEGAGNVRYRGGRVVTDGPDRGAIERRTGRRVDRADLVGAREQSGHGIRRDGSRETIHVYRPEEVRREAGAERLPERPERLRETGRRPEIDGRGGELWRQLRRAEEGEERRGEGDRGSSGRREVVPERRDERAAPRQDDRSAFRPARPEPPATGRPEPRVRERERGGDVRETAPRVTERAGGPESRGEGNRTRGEERSGGRERR